MNEILTPERVLELGQEWTRIFLSNLPPEQLDAYLNPEYKRALVNAGPEEGREEGKLELIEQILERRLGTMPIKVKEQLRHCTLTGLNGLVNPALDATTWAEFVAALPKQTS